MKGPLQSGHPGVRGEINSSGRLRFVRGVSKPPHEACGQGFTAYRATRDRGWLRQLSRAGMCGAPHKYWIPPPLLSKAYQRLVPLPFEEMRSMTLNPVSASSSVPAQAPPVAKTKPAAAPEAAQPTPSQAKAKVISATISAAATALQEATETSAQTAKEAAGGDRQAQRILTKQAAAAQSHQPGRIVNTKA